MMFTSDPFESMTLEELGKYVEILTGLQLRLMMDDLNEDHRRSPKILSAKYLAATDVKRAVGSLTEYRELVSRSAVGEGPSEAPVESGR